MAVKLIMTWDIAPEHEEEYFEFVVRDFIPGVQRLGFDLSDAWATVYGTNHPQIMVGVVIPGLTEAKKVLHSQDWQNLSNRLQEFVKNYTFKIIEAHGGFQF